MLQDVGGSSDLSGGLRVVTGGDFAQILPVIQGGTRVEIDQLDPTPTVVGERTARVLRPLLTSAALPWLILLIHRAPPISAPHKACLITLPCQTATNFLRVFNGLCSMNGVPRSRTSIVANSRIASKVAVGDYPNFEDVLADLHATFGDPDSVCYAQRGQ